MPYFKSITIVLLIAIAVKGLSQVEGKSDTTAVVKEDPSYVVFGFFCASCSGPRAPMYFYDMLGNSKILLFDSTESFWNGKLIFKTEIKDIHKLQKVEKLVQQIPAKLLKSNKSEERFGCPDCFDGGGFYFEIGQGKTKKFYIDVPSNKELEQDIREFADLIKATLKELK